MAYRPTEKTQAHKVAVRESVLAAACTCVFGGGFQALTIAAVAQQAGIATGAVYKHFASKAQLCSEVFHRVNDKELAMMSAAARGEGTATARAHAAIRVFSERALRNKRLAYALIAEPIDPLVEVDRLHFRRAYSKVYEQLIEEGMRSGEFTPQNAQISAAAVVGSVCESLVGPLSWQEDVNAATPPDELIASIQAFCLRAVGANTQSPNGI